MADAPNCPFPLVVPDDPNTETIVYTSPFTGETVDSGCQINCENVVYTESEWTGILSMLTFFSVVGFLCSLFVLATWLTDKKKRSTQRRIVHFSFSTAVIGFSFIIVEMAGRTETWCYDNTRHSHSGMCATQAFFLCAGALSTAFWWFWIAFQTYTNMMGSEVMKKIDSYEKTITCISYGVPIFLLTIAAAADKLGRPYPNIFACFINGDSNSAWEYSLFYAPLTVLIVAGSALVTRILLFVLRHLREARGALSDEAAEKYRGTIIRLTVFLLFYLFVFVVIVAYRLENKLNYDEYYDALYTWISCRLLLKDSPNMDQFCGKTAEKRYPLSLYHLTLLCTPGCGIGVFLVYGTKAAHAAHWAKTLRGWRARLSGAGGASFEEVGGEGTSATLRSSRADSAAHQSSKGARVTSKTVTRTRNATTDNVQLTSGA